MPKVIVRAVHFDDPGSSTRFVSEAELQHRTARRREALARLHDTFPDALGALPKMPPVELGDLSAEQLAALTVDVLWPPSQEELAERARRHLAAVFGSTDAASVEQDMGQPAERA